MEALLHSDALYGSFLLMSDYHVIIVINHALKNTDITPILNIVIHIICETRTAHNCGDQNV